MSIRRKFTLFATATAITLGLATPQPSVAQLTTKPTVVFTIAADDEQGDIRFGYVASAVQLSNGMLAVADGHEHRLILLDQQGKVIRTIGRMGEGPGEFKGIAAVGECARGEVFAYDRILQRMTVVSVTGTVLRTTPLASPPYTMTCSPAGVVVLPQMPSLKGAPVGPGATVLYKADLVLADATLKQTVVIPQVPLGELRTLGRFASFAVSGHTVAVATADSAFIDLYSAAGKRTGRLRAGVMGRTPTLAQYTAAAEQLSAALAIDAQRRASVKLMLKQPMPERLPPYSKVIAAGADGFWVVESFAGDRELLVARYGLDTRRQFVLALPGSAQVHSATHEVILATVPNADGSEQLVGYRAPTTRR